MKTKIAITVLLIVLAVIARRALTASDTLIDGALAASTLDPSNAAHIAQQSKPTLAFAVWPVAALLAFMVWLPRKAKGVVGTASVALALMVSGCGPAKTDQFVEVGPNDTAFVIPLQGDNATSQNKFNSAEYLNTKKVAAKRIQLPLVSKNTGRMWFDYEWISGVRVITVNRAMVSREWSPPSGQGDKDDSIPVVTRDSIQLGVGCAVTAFIEEEDAATYLYFHGEKPLKEVMDQNVRNWVVAELTKEYGQLELSQAQTNFPNIFAKVFLDAKAFFKPKGITILQLGNAEGYEFKKPEIQKALNATFVAEQDNKTAAQEKLAQDVRNQKLLASAETERKAAEELFKAQEAAKMKTQLEIQQMNAKAALEMATKWNGALPANILPANSPLLLNLNK